MRKGIEKKLMIYLLCSMMLGTSFTGCGRAEEIPELIEPAVMGSNYRPVERGEVGDVMVEQGIVVPKDYCHFYTVNISIDSILTDVGEYVEEGQVLAVADIEEVKQEIGRLQEQINNMSYETEIQDEIFEQNEKLLKLQIESAKDEGNKEGKKEAKKNLSLLSENNRYDKQLAAYRKSKLSKQLSELNAIVNEGTIKARHSGYVTYVKDIANSRQVEPLENVVIVSDYEALSLSVPSVLVNNEKYMDCNYIYVEIDGKRQILSELAYSKEELSKAEAMGEYPRLNYRLPEGVKKEVGTKFPVCFCKEDKSGVLKVGVDSLYQEGDRYFVYVKTAESDMERRDIEIGEKDDYYGEVLSGLTEGELVYYQSTAIPTAGSEEHEVALSDYSVPIVLTSDFYPTDSRAYPMYAAFPGTVSQLKVQRGDEVEKGSLIAVLQVGEGASDLKSAQNDIARLEEGHKDSEKEYKKQVKNLEGQIKSAKKVEKKSKKKEETDEEADTAKLIENQEREIVMTSASEKSESEAAEAPTDEKSESGATESLTDEKSEGEAAETLADEQNEGNGMLPSAEELTCQLAILRAQHKLDENNYKLEKKNAEDNYAKLKKQYNGDGTLNLYAERAGTITMLNIHEGDKIKAGDGIYTLEEKVSGKYSVFVDTENTWQKLAGLNERVDFIYTEQKGLQDGEDAKVVAEGHCVGIQADSSVVYLSTIDGEVYLTKCDSMSKSRFFAVLEEESRFGDKEINGVRYENDRMENVITLSTKWIHSEEDKAKGNAVKYYVWRKIDGEIVKQYVVLYQPNEKKQATEGAKVVVLSGLKAGDIVLE